ncbi:hypothetical protein ACWCWD_11640 [Streptomyces sp. NPDC001493]
MTDSVAVARRPARWLPPVVAEAALALFVAFSFHSDSTSSACDFAAQDQATLVTYLLLGSLPVTWALLAPRSIRLRRIGWTATALRFLFTGAVGLLMLVGGGTSLC